VREEFPLQVGRSELSSRSPVAFVEKSAMLVDTAHDPLDQTPPKALQAPVSCRSRNTLSMNKRQD
jgi:hypothetical protein